MLLVPFSVQATLPSVSIYDITFRFLSWCLVLLLGGTLLLSLLALLIKAPSGNLVIRKIRKGYIILFGFLTVNLAGFFLYSLVFHPPFFALEEHPILPTDRSQGLSQFGEKYENQLLDLDFSYPKAYNLKESIFDRNNATLVLTEKETSAITSTITMEIIPQAQEVTNLTAWVEAREGVNITQAGVQNTKVNWYSAVRYYTNASCEVENTVFFTGQRIFKLKTEACSGQAIKDVHAILQTLFLADGGNRRLKLVPIHQ